MVAADFFWEFGIVGGRIYGWRSRDGGTYGTMTGRLMELQIDTAFLQKIYAEKRLKAVIGQETFECEF